MVTELLCLPDDLGHAYFVASRAYRSREIHFDARMRRQLGVFSVWYNIKLFSVMVLDRPEYNCRVSNWWAQYKPLVLFFVPTPLILSYYSGLAVQGSADEKRRVRTVALM